MQSENPTLVEQILDVLNRHDPTALNPGGDAKFSAPRDEYEPEARDLAERLQANGSISAAEVDAVWQHWFSQPSGIAEQLAADLNGLVAA